MKTYAAMKNSGVAWQGDIPADWQQKRAKFLFYKSQQKPLGDDDVVTAFRDGEVVLRSQRRTDGFTFADKEIGYQHVDRGDLVIHAMDAFAGAIGVSKSNGKMSPVCSICKPLTQDVDTTYYAYLLRAMTKTNWLVAIAKGIRERSTDFRYSDFGNMLLPLPPLHTQKAIVAYINEETALIDDLIAKQQRLLELLEEKRRATITSAVTRGLNPNAELKDTGIEWLGKIPAHWELKKLKNTIDSQKNGVWGSDADGKENDINCIRVADFDRYNLRVSNGKFTQRSIENKDRQGRLLSRGDLLFEKSGGGDNQLVGQVVKYDSEEPAVTSNFVARLTVANGYDVDFLVFLHAALYYQRINYRSIKQTSGIQNIDSQAYFNEFVGIPSLGEQQDIAEYLLSENKLVEDLNVKINKQIDLLKERRTSLISSAVTGKIKV